MEEPRVRERTHAENVSDHGARLISKRSGGLAKSRLLPL